MPSENIAIIIGNLGRDAELKFTQSNVPVVNFSVATTESWKGSDDEWQEKTEWHKVVIWRQEKWGELKKGESVYVSGKMETRSWEKDGQKHYVTEIKAKKVMRLGPKKTAENYTAPDVPDDSDLPF